MATGMDSSQGWYTITGGGQGKRWLNLLAEIMQPATLRLLRDAGLRAGDRCPDPGCGGGHPSRASGVARAAVLALCRAGIYARVAGSSAVTKVAVS
jgi:hypothetical protein